MEELDEFGNPIPQIPGDASPYSTAPGTVGYLGDSQEQPTNRGNQTLQMAPGEADGLAGPSDPRYLQAFSGGYQYGTPQGGGYRQDWQQNQQNARALASNYDAQGNFVGPNLDDAITQLPGRIQQYYQQQQAQQRPQVQGPPGMAPGTSQTTRQRTGPNSFIQRTQQGPRLPTPAQQQRAQQQTQQPVYQTGADPGTAYAISQLEKAADMTRQAQDLDPQRQQMLLGRLAQQMDSIDPDKKYRRDTPTQRPIDRFLEQNGKMIDPENYIVIDAKGTPHHFNLKHDQAKQQPDPMKFTSADAAKLWGTVHGELEKGNTEAYKAKLEGWRQNKKDHEANPANKDTPFSDPMPEYTPISEDAVQEAAQSRQRNIESAARLHQLGMDKGLPGDTGTDAGKAIRNAGQSAIRDEDPAAYNDLRQLGNLEVQSRTRQLTDKEKELAATLKRKHAKRFPGMQTPEMSADQLAVAAQARAMRPPPGTYSPGPAPEPPTPKPAQQQPQDNTPFWIRNLSQGTIPAF